MILAFRILLSLITSIRILLPVAFSYLLPNLLWQIFALLFALIVLIVGILSDFRLIFHFITNYQLNYEHINYILHFK